MKAAAYEQANGGPMSSEMALLNAIDRFGVQAVMGRPVLYTREIMAMKTAETILMAFQDRARAENWASWQIDNPQLASLLFEAQQLTNG